ncbi:MAG: DUF349 domain-containing protein [Ornithinimicrobium sp.]
MSESAKPRKPAPPVPSPAAFAGRKAAVRPMVPAASTAAVSAESMAFGRVDTDGTVYVKTGNSERAVGSYPGSTDEEALSYFARKYEDLAAASALLAQRLAQTDLSAHEAREALKTLKDHIGEANVVGDLDALQMRVAEIESAVQARGEQEAAQRAEAKVAAARAREKVVKSAEKLAKSDPAKVQWKSASARMRELFDLWKSQQHDGPRLDKPDEDALWQRFSAARSEFETARRSFFAALDEEHDTARREKEKLVAAAEALAVSKDWGPTATEFKRLMERWRQAGRAGRSVDDALWARFKTAQDQFFSAKDEVMAVERQEFEANLVVKEALLVEAEALLPVKDLGAAKQALRSIQDRWDAAGKVPRSDMQRIEGRMRKVEQAVRDREDQKWKRSNPELNARARSMVEQLESAVAELEQDVKTAQAAGDTAAVSAAEQALAARRQWLESARSGLAETGG